MYNDKSGVYKIYKLLNINIINIKHTCDTKCHPTCCITTVPDQANYCAAIVSSPICPSPIVPSTGDTLEELSLELELGVVEVIGNSVGMEELSAGSLSPASAVSDGKVGKWKPNSPDDAGVLVVVFACNQLGALGFMPANCCCARRSVMLL